jgi:hypothetical protein
VPVSCPTVLYQPSTIAAAVGAMSRWFTSSAQLTSVADDCVNTIKIQTLCLGCKQIDLGAHSRRRLRVR